MNMKIRMQLTRKLLVAIGSDPMWMVVAFSRLAYFEQVTSFLFYILNVQKVLM